MKEKHKQVIVYTDGSCKPNPGLGGYGIVLIYGKARKELSGGFRLTTSNRMEIYAAIKALEVLKEPCEVILYSDSKYLVDAMMQGWARSWKKKNWRRNKKRERAANPDLWEKVLTLCERHIVEFVWVKSHDDNPENNRCDELAYTALEKDGLPVDEGYENQPQGQLLPFDK
jgi:ribonuclease HI